MIDSIGVPMGGIAVLYANTADGNSGVELAMIYAIKAVGVSFIKFGRANNVARRLRELNTACPVDCEIIAIADWPDNTEKGIHAYLVYSHQKGEWFRESKRSAEVVSLLLDRDNGLERFRAICIADKLPRMGKQEAQTPRACAVWWREHVKSPQEQRRAERQAWWARKGRSDRGVGATCCGALGRQAGDVNERYP